VQLIKGNTFAGTAFGSYGAFWLGWGLLEYLTKTTPAAYAAAHTGLTLWCGL
jgi:succinate-acetate transporter protein